MLASAFPALWPSRPLLRPPHARGRPFSRRPRLILRSCLGKPFPCGRSRPRRTAACSTGSPFASSPSALGPASERKRFGYSVEAFVVCRKRVLADFAINPLPTKVGKVDTSLETVASTTSHLCTLSLYVGLIRPKLMVYARQACICDL